MFSKAHGRIVEALNLLPGMEPDVAHQVATALTIDTQRLEHKGTLAISATLPEHSRKFSPHTGASNLKPVPPVEPPMITRGLLELRNAPRGLSDRRGENGYALRIKEGNFVNEGASHILHHAQVQTTTTVTDTRATELNTSLVNATYYVADCLECADSKGRRLSDVPIRVFCQDQDSLPEVGDVIRYLHDTDGLAWRLAESTNPDTRWAVATTGWTWESGYEDQVGEVVCIDADDIYGNTSGYTTSRIYMRATSAQDPNVQPNDVIAYETDSTGRRIVAEGYGLDAKIGTGEFWFGEPGTVKGGWKRFVPMDQRVPVGYEPGDCDYDPQGSTGGSHPIRPKEHAYTEPSDSTTEWKPADCHGTYYETAWILQDHDPEAGAATTTGLTIGSATLAATSVSMQISVGAAVGDTDSGGTTLTGNQSLTIIGSPTIVSTSLTATGSVSVNTTTLWLGGTPSITSTSLSGIGVTGSITIWTTSLGLTGSPSIGTTSVPVSGTISITSQAGYSASGDLTIAATTVTLSGAPTIQSTSVGLTGTLDISPTTCSATGSVSVTGAGVTITGAPSSSSASPSLSGSIDIQDATGVTGSGSGSAASTSLSLSGSPTIGESGSLNVIGTLGVNSASVSATGSVLILTRSISITGAPDVGNTSAQVLDGTINVDPEPLSATGSVTVTGQSVNISGIPGIVASSTLSLGGSLTVDPASVSATGSVTILGRPLGIIGTTASSVTGISINAHGPHTHHISPTASVMDLLTGIIPEGLTWETEEVVPEDSTTDTENTSLTHSVSDSGHVHGSGTLDVTPDPHDHGTSGFSVTIPDHDHSVTNLLSMPAHLHVMTVGTLAGDSHVHGTSGFSVTIPDHNHALTRNLKMPAHDHPADIGTLDLSTSSHDHGTNGFSVTIDDHSHTVDENLTVGSHAHTWDDMGTLAIPDHGHGVTIDSISINDHDHVANTSGLSVASHTHTMGTGNLAGASHTHGTSGFSVTVDPHDHDNIDLSTFETQAHSHTATISGLSVVDHGHSGTVDNISIGGHDHGGSASFDLSADSHTPTWGLDDLAIPDHGHSAPENPPVLGFSHPHRPENLTVLEFSHSHGGELNDMVIQSGLGDDIHGHTADVESITIDDHGHSWSLNTMAIDPDPHQHSVAQHVHGLGGHVHSTSASTSISLEHTHPVVDPGHQHSSPTLAHTGYLYHRTEDFRMKWRSTIFIERVGPDDD